MLQIYGDQRFGDYQTFCGNVQEQRGRTAGGKLYIQFVSNSLDVGLGFALVYKKITGKLKFCSRNSTSLQQSRGASKD